MKQTPKSCGCEQCKLSRIRKQVRVAEQRAFRHLSKQRLNQGDELQLPAYHGSRVS